jgi:NifB/MoaA-like Fe-S oxidoreductase
LVFKRAAILMAPDADAEKSRASTKSPKTEDMVVVVPLFEYDEIAKTCRELADHGVREIILCPGFSHEGVAIVSRAVKGRAAVAISRLDPDDAAHVNKILQEEKWL